jgi:rubrerythrin
MEQNSETVDTVQGRLEVLNKSLISEENSVQYYETLLEKTPSDSEQNIGRRRIYEELHQEEKKHVATIQALLDYWESKLDELKAS